LLLTVVKRRKFVLQLLSVPDTLLQPDKLPCFDTELETLGKQCLDVFDRPTFCQRRQ